MISDYQVELLIHYLWLKQKEAAYLHRQPLGITC